MDDAHYQRIWCDEAMAAGYYLFHYLKSRRAELLDKARQCLVSANALHIRSGTAALYLVRGGVQIIYPNQGGRREISFEKYAELAEVAFAWRNEGWQAPL